MTPFAPGLMAIQKRLAEHRNRAGNLYRITNAPRYADEMAKIDAYLLASRMQYPEYFYSDRELEIMDNAHGENFTRQRNKLDR
jgi:hypothetical protein